MSTEGLEAQRQRLYAAIQDPEVRKLAMDVVSAQFYAAERYGWENAVRYVQDMACGFTNGLPEATGAEALLTKIRAAGLAEQPHGPNGDGVGWQVP